MTPLDGIHLTELNQDMALKPKILIVDDDSETRFLIREILRRDGYDIFEAQDGNDGLTKFRAERPDVVIADIVMPGKDGLEMIADLRHEFPDVKVIAISGEGQDGDQLRKACSLGAKKALAKPFDIHGMIRLVKETLAHP